MPRATLDDLAILHARGEPVELIDGELVRKGPHTFDHGATHAKLAPLLSQASSAWWLAMSVDVLYPETSDCFCHDLVGWRRDRVVARPSGMPVRATPDWVAEVLSPSTARYDAGKKAATLHRHGVAHYWLISPEHQTLTVLRHTADGYLQALVASPGDLVHADPFPEIELTIADLFPRE